MLVSSHSQVSLFQPSRGNHVYYNYQNYRYKDLTCLDSEGNRVAVSVNLLMCQENLVIELVSGDYLLKRISFLESKINTTNCTYLEFLDVCEYSIIRQDYILWNYTQSPEALAREARYNKIITDKSYSTKHVEEMNQKTIRTRNIVIQIISVLWTVNIVCGLYVGYLFINMKKK